MKRAFPALVAFIFLSFTTPVYSQSYVLPYPSDMPGSKWYPLQEFVELISPLWYFGEFGEFKNNLFYADKYLVQAKTLFEYEQYLLGVQALEKSDAYFKKIKGTLTKASESGKNISEKKLIFENASIKHQQVLTNLSQEVPEIFEWTPEKKASTKLFLQKTIENSIHLRTI